MNLPWCCILAALTLANANPLPVNVELTVRQVQSILRQNPQLPRLSRDDIIQLLDDIRAEDARNSREVKASDEANTNKEKSESGNEAEKDVIQESDQLQTTDIEEINNEIPYRKPGFFDDEEINSTAETTTKSNEASVMVVLPYTPRDGSTLQELFTKPPRTELVPESQLTTETTEKMTAASSEKMLETFKKNAELANEARKQIGYPEYKDFLDTHGLSGGPNDDHFLLPLEGFKQLPPANIIDEKVELPENIILKYDLISSNSNKNNNISPNRMPQDFPEYPFELSTAESENLNVAMPLDLPIKSYENLDLLSNDQITVLPLNGGPNPSQEEASSLVSDVGKRQTSSPNEADSDDSNKEPTTTTTEKTVDEGVKTDLDNSTSNKNADSVSLLTDNFETSAADTGASITDLEDSFGGAAPAEPGDAELPPPKKNGFYWMLDWNSFLEVGDGDTKVNIRFEPKLGDPQMFLPVSVP